MPISIVTATPPTPNGGLHIGHLSGPYFAADVYSRFLRATGEDVVYISSVDINQTYVVKTATLDNKDPLAIAKENAIKIRETFKAFSIDIDVFNFPDEQHSDIVQSFFHKLYHQGIISKKKVPFFKDSKTGAYIYESFLTGYCSNCLSESAGAICEACGHPNDTESLLSPKNDLNQNSQLIKCDVEILVFDLNKYRQNIKNFYQSKKCNFRTHLLDFINEITNTELPVFPISYISDWGVPVNFGELSNQTFNPWAEMLPGFMRSAGEASSKAIENPVTGESLWKKESGNKLIQFLGFDNSYFFAVAHVALILASDNTYITPDYIITNEFYQLNNFKFSTSKQHVIWANDLLSRRTADEVRFYLALTNPQHQKANFREEDMDMVNDTSLLRPWLSIISKMNYFSKKYFNLENIDKKSPRLLECNCTLAEKMSRKFHHYYEAEFFDLQKNAEYFCSLLKYINNELEVLELLKDHEKEIYRLGILWAAISYLPALISPLLPNFSERLRSCLDQDNCKQWPSHNELLHVQPILLVDDILPLPRNCNT